MANYAIVENGIVSNMAAADPEFAAQQGWVAAPEGVAIGWIYDGKNFFAPPRYPDIATGKADVANQISAKRDSLEGSGFAYLGKTIDSDPRSVQRINTAAQAAQAAASSGRPFALDWTCADGSLLSLDATAMIGMPVALAQHANALHHHARALKTLVEAAETSSDLESIDIESGWPGGI